jgi:uncharacterized protein (TIGR00156 family)
MGKRIEDDVMKRRMMVALCFAMVAAPVMAQFSGPSARGQAATAAEVASLRLGAYVVLTGNVVAHLRGDHYTFRDATGEVRVEIEQGVWRGREVTPETTVQLVGEIDRGLAGRYVWVKSLDITS